MNKILSIITLFLLQTVMVFAGDARFESANSLCQQGKYEEAIKSFEQIVSEGKESSALYYNLGYAYYKTGKLAQAIVNFERANKLAPSDEDINYNLELAYSQTADKISKVDDFILVKWINSIIYSVSGGFWASFGIIMLIIGLAGLAVFLFLSEVLYRKIGFGVAIGGFLLMLLAFGFAKIQKHYTTNKDFAIIIESTVSIKSTPDMTGKELFILHEGTKVKIKQKVGSWNEIQLNDGNTGWINTSAIEVI